MREIKFRGNRVDNSKWVYGLPLYSVVGGKAIIDTIQSYEDLCFYTVIPETVGQFTGLKDKNGKEIYEGDIVRSSDGHVTAIVKIGSCYPVAIKKYCELMGIREHSTYCLHAYDKDGVYFLEDNKSLEVIGNIHGNELMEENNENN